MAVMIINEDFNPSFPRWLVKDLGRKYGSPVKSGLLKRGVDLNRANFVSEDPPASSRDPRLKDDKLIPVFYMTDGSVYSPAFKGSSDNYFSYKDSRGINQYKTFHSTPWKDILNNAISFGYIDISNATNLNKDLRSQRRTSKQGVVDREKNAQYSRPIYGDKKDKYGFTSNDPDNIVGYDWLTKTGYDKSGYPLDPEKYVKMLNNIDMSNYAQKLKRYYDMIKRTQTELSKAITSADIDNLRYKSRGYHTGNVMSDIQDAANALSRAISDYRDIQRNIERIVNKPNMSDEEKNEYLQSWWGPNGKSVYDYIKEANEYIKSVLANDSYPEED